MCHEHGVGRIVYPRIGVGAGHAERETRRNLDELAIERFDGIIVGQEQLPLPLAREVRPEEVRLLPQSGQLLRE